MTNPLFIEEKPLSLAEVKDILHDVEKRDKELNFLSNKGKEYLDAFVAIDTKKGAELKKKLLALDLTRLKEEHIAKIIDFMPKDANDLKIVLQAYPLSMPKKDQDAIVATVKEFS